jgi:hypothetical protein
VKNSVRDLRAPLSWTQAELARNSGIAANGQRHRDGKIPSQPAAGMQDRKDLPQASGGDFQGLNTYILLSKMV